MSPSQIQQRRGKSELKEWKLVDWDIPLTNNYGVFIEKNIAS